MVLSTCVTSPTWGHPAEMLVGDPDVMPLFAERVRQRELPVQNLSGCDAAIRSADWPTRNSDRGFGIATVCNSSRETKVLIRDPANMPPENQPGNQANNQNGQGANVLFTSWACSRN